MEANETGSASDSHESEEVGNYPAPSKNVAGEKTDPVELDENRIHPEIDTSVNEVDVLCGRGKPSFNHPGNKRFRDTVANSLEEYMKAASTEGKTSVAREIVQTITSRGGKFLRKDQLSNQWVELTAQECKQKVAHALRDAVSKFEESSSLKSKKRAARRRERSGNLRQALNQALLTRPTIQLLNDSAANLMSNQNQAVVSSQQSSFESPSLQMQGSLFPSQQIGHSRIFHIPPATALAGVSAAALGSSIPSSVNNTAGIERGYAISNWLPATSTSAGFPSTPRNQQQQLFNISVQRQQRPELQSQNQSGVRHQESGDDQFLAAIDDVLGPLPTDAQDPMERFIQRDQSRTEEHPRRHFRQDPD